MRTVASAEQSGSALPIAVTAACFRRRSRRCSVPRPLSKGCATSMTHSSPSPCSQMHVVVSNASFRPSRRSVPRRPSEARTPPPSSAAVAMTATQHPVCTHRADSSTIAGRFERTAFGPAVLDSDSTLMPMRTFASRHSKAVRPCPSSSRLLASAAGQVAAPCHGHCRKLAPPP